MTGNQGLNGGGISTQGPLTVSCSVFINNTAEGGSGLNVTNGAPVTVRYSRFEGNTGSIGVDIWNTTPAVTVNAQENYWGVDGIPEVAGNVDTSNPLAEDPTAEATMRPECEPQPVQSQPLENCTVRLERVMNS